MMKHILLYLTVLLLSVGSLIAQEESTNRSYFTGGALTFSHSNGFFGPSAEVAPNPFLLTAGEGQNTSLFFNPYIGKELSSRLSVGLEFSYGVGRTLTENVNFTILDPPVDVESISNQFGFGIFSRHTLNPQHQLNFYIQPYANYFLGRDQEKFDGDLNQESQFNYVELGAGVGILYNVNQRIRVLLRNRGLRYINGVWELQEPNGERQTFSSFESHFNLSNVAFGFEFKF